MKTIHEIIALVKEYYVEKGISYGCGGLCDVADYLYRKDIISLREESNFTDYLYNHKPINLFNRLSYTGYFWNRKSTGGRKRWLNRHYRKTLRKNNRGGMSYEI